jgi:hypothetical protein
MKLTDTQLTMLSAAARREDQRHIILRSTVDWYYDLHERHASSSFRSAGPRKRQSGESLT